MERHLDAMIEIRHLTKTYANGFKALAGVDLEIKRGEIFALLGPNGAGKTTLISTVCGLVTPTSGRISVAGFDIIKEYRAARSLIGLVPQELTTDAFETVWATVSFSRGVFGLPPSPEFVTKVLSTLSLIDKKDSRLRTLSGGMKRRVMIAKALAHEPEVLFLDEPTAGVDVELRRDMWRTVRDLKNAGKTIILTTHYIEEAEQMADRIGVINAGRILVVEEKASLMRQFGRKQLHIELRVPLAEIPPTLATFAVSLADEGRVLVFDYDTQAERTGITRLLNALRAAEIGFRDLSTRQNTLEEIFVDLIRRDDGATKASGTAPAGSLTGSEIEA
ncbi:MAG: ABC transporter ATP-binding protein [Hyphomicrobiaceae bacterium]